MTNSQVAEKAADVESEEKISSTTQGLSSDTKSQIKAGSIRNYNTTKIYSDSKNVNS